MGAPLNPRQADVKSLAAWSSLVQAEDCCLSNRARFRICDWESLLTTWHTQITTVHPEEDYLYITRPCMYVVCAFPYLGVCTCSLGGVLHCLRINVVNCTHESFKTMLHYAQCMNGLSFSHTHMALLALAKPHTDWIFGHTHMVLCRGDDVRVMAIHMT